MSGCHRFWQVLRDVEGAVDGEDSENHQLHYRDCISFPWRIASPSSAVLLGPLINA